MSKTHRDLLTNALPGDLLLRLDAIASNICHSETIFSDRTAEGYSNEMKYSVLCRHFDVSEIDMLGVYYDYDEQLSAIQATEGQSVGSAQIVCYAADLRAQIVAELLAALPSDADAALKYALTQMHEMEVLYMVRGRVLLSTLNPANVAAQTNQMRIS